MNWDAVLFDLEGVLLEGRSTPDGIYESAVNSIIDSESLTEEQRRVLISPDDFDDYEELCSEQDLDPDSFWSQKEDAASEREIDHISEGKRNFVENAFETLEELENQDVTMGLVSNNSQKVVDHVVSDSELSEYMEVSYGITNTIEGYNQKKPEPYYIEEAMNDLDLDSEDDVLYIGDKLTDVEAAVAAGATPVLLYENSDRLGTEDPESLPGYSISQLEELPEVG